MLTTKHKPIVDTRKKENQSIQLQKIIKAQRKRARKAQRNYKTNKIINKMSILTSYLSIIALNLTKLFSNKKTKIDWMNHKIKKAMKARPSYVLPVRDTL